MSLSFSSYFLLSSSSSFFLFFISSFFLPFLYSSSSFLFFFLASYLFLFSSSFFNHCSSYLFLLCSPSCCYCWISSGYWPPNFCDCFSSSSLFLLISFFFLERVAFSYSRFSPSSSLYYSFNGSYFSFLLCIICFSPYILLLFLPFKCFFMVL